LHRRRRSGQIGRENGTPGPIRHALTLEETMRKLLVLAVIAALAGCTPPVYGKSNILGSPGYSDKQLAEGVWEVTFRAMGPSGDDRYQIAALYRAAELARDAGFPFFQLVRFKGRVTVRALGPNDYIARLTVRGVRTRDEELKCESEAATDCGTYSTEEILRTFAPRLTRQPPGDPGASPLP
jgi:hypothetical protein